MSYNIFIYIENKLEIMSKAVLRSLKKKLTKTKYKHFVALKDDFRQKQNTITSA